jgi:hypothetical protein
VFFFAAGRKIECATETEIIPLGKGRKNRIKSRHDQMFSRRLSVSSAKFDACVCKKKTKTKQKKFQGGGCQ